MGAICGESSPGQATIAPVADCLFCKIVAGDVPADKVAESDHIVAFRDINPQAPTHVLIIPKDHYPDLAALAGSDGALLTEIAVEAGRVAEAGGIADSGYRVVFNTGPEAGQTVFHVHAHVLGGRRLEWPPG
jgi:histidine triad (HIT) family protein